MNQQSLSEISASIKQKGFLHYANYLLAVGLGSGLAKKAPGTFGSLAALLFYPLWQILGVNISFIAVLASSIVGIFICDMAAKDMQIHDSPHIVFDEWAGQWIALLPLIYHDAHWLYIAVSFALFRFFDILKPWPISYVDKHVDGGFGIMVDDLIAGIIVAILFIMWF